MDQIKDYYATLEICKGASTNQIKRAYRNLALKWHPDRVSVNAKEDAEQIFKEIVEAFYVLGHEQRRKIYDQQLGFKSNFYKPPRSHQETTHSNRNPYQSFMKDVILDEFYRKQRANRNFESPDWLEILGGTKAKGLAVILMALSVVIYSYIPQIVFTEFSSYGAYVNLIIPVFAFFYIVVEPIREYFSPSDKIFCEVCLVASWLALIAPLFIVLLSVLLGVKGSMCMSAACRN